MSMLKPIYIVEGYEQDPNLGKYTRPTILRYDILAYRKDDADAAIDALKARIHALESMPHTDNRAVIERLINANERLKAQIAEVEENHRWRKCSEEKPKDGQEVWAYDSRQKLVLKLEYQVREFCEGFVGPPLIFWPCITYWMPFEKPKAPEGK